MVEFRHLLRDCGWRLVAPADRGLTLEVDETGESYAANALLKARAFAGASGLSALADDSGLEVDALDGRPGIHSARFGGPGLTAAQRVTLLLDRLQAAPDAQRGARFRAVLVLAQPRGETWQTEGVCEGRVAHHPSGSGGFGYDPIFVPAGYTCSMAELSDEQKNQISHRAHAAAAMGPILRQLAHNG